MGAYERRQLRAAFSLLVYPMILALVLTLLAKMFFGHSNSRPSIHPTSSSSSTSKDEQQQQQQQHISQALVVASTTKDDTTWLDLIPPSLNWTLHHYRVDAPLTPVLSVPSNRGNEAMVYLTYIIDNYDSLPDVILFKHGHRRAWHQVLDSLEEISRLRPEYVLKTGYASTRCLPGCENVVPLEGAEPGDWAMFQTLSRKVHLVTLLDAFLEPHRYEAEKEMPKKLAAPCCAQFAVTRESIRRRDRDWWVDLRGWLINTPLKSINSGRLLEHLWHVWFGMEPVLCPSQEACQCHVFGIGDDCASYFEQEKYM